MAASSHPRDDDFATEQALALTGDAPDLPLEPGEAWSDAALGRIRSLDEEPRSAWRQLVAHCAKATGGKPSGKWLETAGSLLDRLGREAFGEDVRAWFPLVDRPRTRELPVPRWGPDPNLLIDDANADVLKGLVWCTSLCDAPEVARAVATLALSAYRKVPGIGPRATKVGNACVWALGEMPGDTALAALAGLKVRVKFRTAQKGIEKALDAVAERAGMTRAELDELGVPAYGLEEVGLRREQLGEVRAELAVVGSRTELRWFRADGKQQKSVPKSVREEHADELKELRRAAKDIEQMLSAQRERLDAMFLARKSWTFAQWRERYLDHPLVGTLARRLVWGFGEAPVLGIWRDDRLVDVRGGRLAPDDDVPVSLWHPLDSDRDTVVAWREWLEEHELQQPFKQAHREIYLLTDAERETRVYSNRYAAHVLKQHQFNALCAVRGWQSKLRLMVDDDYPPATLELPDWNLRAEFWVEGAGDDYGTDTNETGTYWHLATDQVRFHRPEAAGNLAHAGGGGYVSAGTDREENRPLALSEIPVLVFSEVMRDVDLFVGVASVGNDPTWSDGGAEGRYRDYWHGYSFGELGATAETRRDVLERLIPSLKIRDRCRIDGRFLVVRGDRRTYKIHLGSGNVLMEPDDQYLCIVQSRRAGRKADVFLPFEGDARLSLILSKALLLAEDLEITDDTILSQIGA